MAMTLSFKLQLPPLVNEQVNDCGGNWQYVGTSAVEQSSGESVQLIAMKRENRFGTISFAASMLTATVMYPAMNNDVPQNLTIQGIHDLASNNETGSVSSASSKFTEYVGGTFSFDAKEGVLEIRPR